MPEANPPYCQIVRDEYGDCRVAGCGTAVEYKPPNPVVISVNPNQVVCDAARRILEEEANPEF